MGKFSDFVKKLYDVEEVYDENEGYYDENDYSTEEYYNDDFAGSESSYTAYEDVPYQAEQPVAVATPVAAPQASATVIMLTPYDIRTSQIVCEHIREGHIVICNLTPNANNQRVVDYISGSHLTVRSSLHLLRQHSYAHLSTLTLSLILQQVRSPVQRYLLSNT